MANMKHMEQLALLSKRFVTGVCWNAPKRLMTTAPLARDLLRQFPGGAVDVHKNNTTGIAEIVINDPSKKNALSGSMMLDLEEVVLDLEAWEAGRAVVLHGAGATFCSGGNLKLMKGIMKKDSAAIMSQHMHRILTRLRNLPLISVALVQGQALGGGAELLTACDFCLVHENASIGFVQRKMGITVGWGGGSRLVSILGRVKALDLLSTGRILSAQEALDIGLAQSIITGDDEYVMKNALKWLEERTDARAPEVVQAAKRVVLAGCNPDFTKALEQERDIFLSVWNGPAHVAAMSEGIKHNKKQE